MAGLSTDQNWRNKMLEYWVTLLRQSQTGSTLLKGLESAGISIAYTFVNEIITSDGVSANATGQYLSDKAFAVKVSLKSVLASLAKATTDAKFQDFGIRAAAIVGHELFHIAVGDANEGEPGGPRMLGDCGPGGTCLAYRAEGKIYNELKNGGDSEYYNLKSDLMKEYGQAWAFDGRYLMFTMFESFHSGHFRVSRSVIDQALAVAPLRR